MSISLQTVLFMIRTVVCVLRVSDVLVDVSYSLLLKEIPSRRNVGCLYQSACLLCAVT